MPVSIKRISSPLLVWSVDDETDGWSSPALEHKLKTASQPLQLTFLIWKNTG